MSDQLYIQNIREILLKNWDPFCVGDNPGLKDEYDDFIPAIVKLLGSHSDSGSLKEYFENVEKRLEAPTSEECRTRTVEALQNL